MCQLLGMNTNKPDDICFSFTGFRKRGGDTDDHDDGFGLAFFNVDKTAKIEKYSLRTFHDDQPSACSELAEFLANHPIKAQNVLCHIRKASDGNERLINNHPFVREMWGESWAFVHNGQMVKKFTQQLPEVESYYLPIGDTDSEQAFCYLMNRLRTKFAKKPSGKRLFKYLVELNNELGKVGIYNMLLSNGDWQLVYANTLMFYVERKAPFGKATLVDTDVSVNFAKLMKPRQRAVIMTTIPLTHDENWQQFAVGECIIFRKGKIVHHYLPKKPHYLSIEDGLNLAKRACDTV